MVLCIKLSASQETCGKRSSLHTSLSPGWDHHGGLEQYMDTCCGLTTNQLGPDTDLKQRGMLEDTLVIWGGEFGRTSMFQGKGGAGRDHHIKGFSMWRQGGVKGGIDMGIPMNRISAVKDKVHVHDMHATMLHLLGINHQFFNKASGT